MDYEKKNDAFYDLVISDINMPKMDGIEMGSTILQKNISQKIIYITAHTEVDYLLNAIKAGATGFLTKPLNQDDLKFLLYNVSQTIFDHKMIESYYSEIESLNITLQEQNRELSRKNSELEKSLRMLDTMVTKDAIKQTKTHKEEVVLDKKQESSHAHMYEELEDFSFEDYDELIDAYEVIDSAVVEVLQSGGNLSLTQTKILPISERFGKYASTISYYSVFASLGSAMGNFSRVLRDNEIPDKKEDIVNVFTLLESFIFVLKKWQEGLSLKAYESINFLDASLISDMDTIVMMWTQSHEKFDENDAGMEFF